MFASWFGVPAATVARPSESKSAAVNAAPKPASACGAALVRVLKILPRRPSKTVIAPACNRPFMFCPGALMATSGRRSPVRSFETKSEAPNWWDDVYRIFEYFSRTCAFSASKRLHTLSAVFTSENRCYWTSSRPDQLKYSVNREGVRCDALSALAASLHSLCNVAATAVMIGSRTRDCGTPAGPSGIGAQGAIVRVIKSRRPPFWDCRRWIRPKAPLKWRLQQKRRKGEDCGRRHSKRASGTSDSLGRGLGTGVRTIGKARRLDCAENWSAKDRHPLLRPYSGVAMPLQ